MSGDGHARVRAFLCYIIRVIVAAPDADSKPAPTGGGTHPVNHCQQREYQRGSDHCAGLIQARLCALLPPSCVTLMRRPAHAYGPPTSCSTEVGSSHRRHTPTSNAGTSASSSARLSPIDVGQPHNAGRPARIGCDCERHLKPGGPYALDRRSQLRAVKSQCIGVTTR